ncbi:hypothetical protein [Algisphaera agarilytica]|uniref:Uncharacterized protein n=1 Tax=Algisphaera agarilytica TaxID=1385975 RepID=A0A7X0LLL9_9BACT|nr:hypothetical protein [Algisphaera agarilytica]MBB6430098.1 hypothetical protein [Algisphaera agarilytica]
MQKFLTLTALTATLTLAGLAQASPQVDRAHHARENAVAAKQQDAVYNLVPAKNVTASKTRPAYGHMIQGGRGTR